MKKRILSFLLHHANRSVKDFAFGQYTGDFYRVKDAILRKHGKVVGYDIQHIEGKKCYKCHGTGKYDRWDQYGIYDPDWCWGCNGSGWYKDPQWICLQRLQFGRYIFHKPLRREIGVKNPFTKENMGWEVSANPVMEGYVRHKSTWFGGYALAMIMINTPDFKLIVARILREWKWYWQRQIGKLIPKRRYVQQVYINDPDSELPF